MKVSNFIKITFSIGFLVTAFLLSLMIGSESISLIDLFKKSQSLSQTTIKVILFQIRLPRTLLVLLSGALLAGAGAIFQLYFRNPLAEPGIMGISSGATLGAVVAGIIGNAQIFLFSSVSLGAFTGSILAGLVVTTLAARTRNGYESTIMLLLCGTALGMIYSSLSSIILLIHEKELHKLFIWILGSFNGKGWKDLNFIIIPSIIAFCLIFFISSPLDVLAGGEKTAASLGIDIPKIRLFVILAGTLATSSSVCAGGTIGFIGLLAPHIVRKLFGPKSKQLIPLSMVYGALLLIISDILARKIAAPSEIPVGIITSLLGAPFFISTVYSKKDFLHAS